MYGLILSDLMCVTLKYSFNVLFIGEPLNINLIVIASLVSQYLLLIVTSRTVIMTSFGSDDIMTAVEIIGRGSRRVSPVFSM